MPSFLYAIQNDQGREIVAAHVDVEKVSDITAKVEETGQEEDTAYLLFDNLIVASALRGDVTGPFTLCRWPSDNKLAEPVKHPVK